MANKYQLDKLLKKKGWTGKEVGQLLISSMLNDIKQLDKKDKTILFSQSDFEKIENSLTFEYDYTVYGVYRALYSSIIDSFNRGQGLFQQFYNGFFRALNILYEVQHADLMQKNLDDTPLILTESQYNKLKLKAVKTLREFNESYYSILFHLLDNFLDDETKAPEPIITAIENTKKIPAEKISFSRSYNEQTRNGYYTLPDGRRSDRMTNEEWQKALDEIFMSTHKLTINGKPATTEETKKEYKQESLVKSYELFFKGPQDIKKFVFEKTKKELKYTDEEIEEAITYIIDFLGDAQHNSITKELAKALDLLEPKEWHIYEQLPKDLTAYELLGLIVDSSQYKETDPKKHLKAFKTEYTELYNALNTYIIKNVPKAKGLKANQLYKDIVSWGELADAEVIGYKRLIQPDDAQIIDIVTDSEDTTENKSKRIRAFAKGIAIIKSPNETQVDENGDYIEPKNPLYLIKSVFTLEDNAKEVTEIQKNLYNLIYSALGYLYAFNALMKIIGKVYDLPELENVTHYDTSFFENKMYTYNKILYYFYYDVYGNETEQQRKRTIIKKIFTPMQAEFLKPSQEAIEEVTEKLVKLGFSSDARRKVRYLDTFIDRLMSNGEGAY